MLGLAVDLLKHLTLKVSTLRGKQRGRQGSLLFITILNTYLLIVIGTEVPTMMEGDDDAGTS